VAELRYAVATVVIVAALGLGGLGGCVLLGQGDIQNLGVGGSSCGTWLEERKDDGWPAIANDSWVNGYLTGYQDGGNGLTDRHTADLAARSAWINNYCQANPLNALTDAARGLWRERASRQP